MDYGNSSFLIMNKILKLSLSKSEEDQEIAKELLKKNKNLRKHFYNLALYLGPRNVYSTSKVITNRIPQEDGTLMYHWFNVVLENQESSTVKL